MARKGLGSGGIMAKKKSTSRSERAGLSFPVSKLNRRLRTAGRSKRVGAGSPVYTAAILEYTAAEVLELAGAHVLKMKRKRITSSDIIACIRNDQELNQLFNGCAVFSGDKLKNVGRAVTYVEPQGDDKE